MKKKILFLFIQVIVLITAFTSVTYAAFTDQHHPRISPFTFNVKTQNYIMLSESGNANTFKNEMVFNDLIDNNTYDLQPFFGYKDGNDIVIKNAEGIKQTQELRNFIRKSIYFTSSVDMNLYLNTVQTSSNKIIEIVETGPFSSTELEKFADAIRIGFVAYNTNETNIENPSSNTYTPIGANIYSVNLKNSNSYKEEYKDNVNYTTFRTTYYPDIDTGTPVLMNVVANKINKLDIVLWLEDADKNCSDLISGKFKVNLNFVGVEVEESGE